MDQGLDISMDIPATKVRAVSRSLVILFLCLFLSDEYGGGDGDGGSDEQKKWW